MPYAKLEDRRACDRRRRESPRRQRINRAAVRTMRHGADHRQVWLDAGGTCELGRENGCRTYRQLEYHEPFGEDHAGTGKMQTRTLGCLPCHAGDHYYEYDEDFIKNRHKPSLLYEDMMAEIAEAGSVDAWATRYSLTRPENLDPDTTLRVLGGNVEHDEEDEGQ